MDGVFNINKPRGMTSNDVVCKLRKILNMKKIGHGGTLDPDATGVLPVFTGSATRLLEYALGDDKEYAAEFELGIRTDTGDISGKILETAPVPETDITSVIDVLQKFLGVQQQIPPMYSALKVQGRKLYQLARQGVEIERQPRQICIYKLALQAWEPPFLKVVVQCSKGTYIRVLGEDLAKSLGTVGTMRSLVRLRVGNFRLENSHTLEEVAQAPERCALHPLQVMSLPRLSLSPKQAYRLTSGVPTTIKGVENGIYLLLGPGEEFLGVAKAEGEIVKGEKVLGHYAKPEDD